MSAKPLKQLCAEATPGKWVAVDAWNRHKPTAAQRDCGPTEWKQIFGGASAVNPVQADGADLVASCEGSNFHREHVARIRANAQLIARLSPETALRVYRSVEENTIMLAMVAELLRDGPHHAKAEFVREQIEANHLVLAALDGKEGA